MNKSRDCRLLWPSYTLRFLPSYSTPIQCGPHAECRRALPLALLFLCFRDGEVARSRNPPRYTILQHRQSAARTAILFLYDLLSSSFFMCVGEGVRAPTSTDDIPLWLPHFTTEMMKHQSSAWRETLAQSKTMCTAL